MIVCVMGWECWTESVGVQKILECMLGARLCVELCLGRWVFCGGVVGSEREEGPPAF